MLRCKQLKQSKGGLPARSPFPSSSSVWLCGFFHLHQAYHCIQHHQQCLHRHRQTRCQRTSSARSEGSCRQSHLPRTRQQATSPLMQSGMRLRCADDILVPLYNLLRIFVRRHRAICAGRCQAGDSTAPRLGRASSVQAPTVRNAETCYAIQILGSTTALFAAIQKMGYFCTMPVEPTSTQIRQSCDLGRKVAPLKAC